MVHAPQTKLDAFTYKRWDPVQSQLEQLKGGTMPNPLADRNDSQYQSSFLSSWHSIPSVRNEVCKSAILTYYVSNKHLDCDHRTAKHSSKRQNV